jgi:predicted nucleic acid-binding protein
VRVFCDTSALVKRYIEEEGSSELAEILDATGVLAASVLFLPESISAFQRLGRQGHLQPDDVSELKRLVLADLRDMEICQLVPEVIATTVDCLERRSLRTLDALHLGCALAVGPDLFVTADRRQFEAARAEGLTARLLG